MIFKIIFFTLLQIIIIYKVVRNINKNILSLFDIFILVIIDSILSVFLIFPNILSFFARLVGIGRGVDLFMYISIFVLFYFILRLYYKNEKLREDISKLNRELTIREFENKNPKD
ncbi:MAG TPA: DUF2304 domain-containing protein [Spirochaetota bacterium]|nr:DUF2304 domain-containing protein [Spirochaetota bacterium]